MTLFLKTLRERRETAAEHIARLKDTIRLAIAHLEGDRNQADIPASEHKEDSALVAKLKAALR